MQHGREVFDQQCAACHGAKGEGGVGDRLVGGQGTLATPKPVRTVGSYWPYAPTLFDYIRRAMPQNAPQSLSNEDVYAVSAYILNLNGLLPADGTLDAKTLSGDQDAEPQHVHRRSPARREEPGMHDGLLRNKSRETSPRPLTAWGRRSISVTALSIPSECIQVSCAFVSGMLGSPYTVTS